MQTCRICFIEIPAPDLKKAKIFYTSVFGWEVKENEPYDNFWFFNAGDFSGGFEPNAQVDEGGVNLVIEVEDIPGKLEEIKQAGGTILKEKREIGGNYGFYATFMDPNGNRLSIWSKQ